MNRRRFAKSLAFLFTVVGRRPLYSRKNGFCRAACSRVTPDDDHPGQLFRMRAWKKPSTMH